ncbi:hypothetical protein DM02DRAFT_546556 [Periconia macrospinosa]|uniref:BTB domain-containing protein n=1 Tax=Periconia macrospinosa TaxID=97972 RepID=A0A2V1CZD8_9PLEO|nr:hypothetical protein DM02DRAFT_546556 [Periconia macrospinosa]
MEPDPNGDVLLECKDQNSDTLTTFRVSSKVLQLASPVFTGMFGPHFREGQLLQQGENPVIRLEEDDASSMSIIFDILHFRGGGKNDEMDAERLARLAIHCDKYDLAKALGPWVSVWFENVKKTMEPSEELGFMLLAAHLFDNCGEFQEMSEMALKILPLGFEEEWESQELLALLPMGIQDAITIRVKRTLDNLQMELQNVELSLRYSIRGYEIPQRMCMLCGRTLPEVAKKCHPCYNSDLLVKYCTSETRIAEYFAILRKVELWPTVQPFGNSSVADIVSRIARAQSDLKHDCTADSSCPLIVHMDTLTGKARRIEKGIIGLCLRCIKESDGWEDSQRCNHL